MPEDAVFMSTELVQVAEALFKGVSVIFIDVKKSRDMIKELGLTGSYPKLTFSELEPG